MLDRWRAQRASAMQLVQYWDELVGGREHGQPPASASSGMQRAVHQIQTMDDAPAIDPAFSAKLLQELTNPSHEQWRRYAEPFALPSQTGSAMNGRAIVNPPRPQLPAPSLPRWPRVWGLATTALLLLAIGAGIFIWNANREPVPAVIPLLTETTETGFTIETILEEHIPAGEIPENSENLINVWKYVLEPGETFADEPGLCELVPSLTIGYIESGTLSLTTTGPFEVTRAGGATESIPAGREAVLTAGDKYVYYSDTTEHFTGERNAGGEPLVQIVTTWALDKGCASSPPPLIPVWVWGDSKYAYDFDQTRPVRISLERATIQPGSMLSPDDAARIGFAGSDNDIFRLVAVESGTLEETWVPEALMQAERPGIESEVLATFEPAQSWTAARSLAPPEGQERQYRAGAEEPLQLAIYSFVYDDADAR